jgi:hypothetical protein
MKLHHAVINFHISFFNELAGCGTLLLVLNNINEKQLIYQQLTVIMIATSSSGM